MYTQLNGIKKTKDYSLYHSPFVVTHQEELLVGCDIAYKNYNLFFKENAKGSTEDYNRYNIFSLTVNSFYFYIVYKQIVAAIREYVGDDRPLWMQCWMNYHLPHEVLSWHDHGNDFVVHGYLSIDPKNTLTEFKEFSIENKVGTLYLGRTGNDMAHCVTVKEPYKGYRITLAFDVFGLQGPQLHDKYLNLSYIPVP